MVDVMLEGGVQPGMVGVNTLELKARMKVDAICIEEPNVCKEEEVHVCWHDQWENHQRHGPDRVSNKN